MSRSIKNNEFNHFLQGFLIITWVVLLSYTHATAIDMPVEKNISVITDINIKESKAGMTLQVIGNADFTYKIYEQGDPFKVVIDLQNVNIKNFKENIVIERGGVSEIIPTVIDESAGVARLEIVLLEPALKIRDLKKDNMLYVMVYNPLTLKDDQISDDLIIGETSSENEDTEASTIEVKPKNVGLNQKEVDAIVEEKQNAPGSSDEVEKPKTQKDIKPFTTKQYVGKRVNLDFQDIDLVLVFRLLADISGEYNIIVHPSVKGKIPHLKLIDIPWDQALDVILANNGLGKVVEGNIIRIATVTVLTKEFADKAKAQTAEEKAKPLASKQFNINYLPLKDVLKVIKDGNYLTDRGKAIGEEATSTIFVKDTETAIQNVAELIASIDIQIPQVMIEARIVQVDTSMRNTFGIQWGWFKIHGSQGTNSDAFLVGSGVGQSSTGFPDPNSRGFALPLDDVNIPLMVNLPAAAVNSAIEYGFISKKYKFALDLRLTALENSSKGRILSTPKVFTLDNNAAELKEGLQVPYPVQSEDGVSTAYADVTTTLKVTPHIAPNGSIVMELDIKKVDLITFDNLGSVIAPRLSDSTVKTKILVRDKDTIVIGGMYKENSRTAESGTPLLNRVPLVKYLFTNKDKEMSDSEILYFITPTIVDES